jgi:hypothetical protein
VAVSYVDPSGSQAWVYLASHLLELLRNVAWAMVLAFATVGACWAGGAAAASAVAAARRSERRADDDRTDEVDPVTEEVSRGLAEIEAFLAARVEPQRHRADDDADRKTDG